jgi:hypothetical protein
VTVPVNIESVTSLLPLLSRSAESGFNVFDVMHHGTHEKQLSNVFSWVFSTGGTHNFNGLGQRVFVELINKQLVARNEVLLPNGPYVVRQEVNTAAPGHPADIADIVLENDSKSVGIVVENYWTSDGHEHGYELYATYGRPDRSSSTVVLLCAEVDQSRLRDRWEEAIVITYRSVLDALVQQLEGDKKYAKENGEQFAFLLQMHRKFSIGRVQMNDKRVLEFVAAMCATGEARRYQQNSSVLAAEQFSIDFADQARKSFNDGKEALQRILPVLKSYVSGELSGQLNRSFGAGVVSSVDAAYRGIYQWTINIHISQDDAKADQPELQIKFGPTAWHANEQDDFWTSRVAPEVADYSRLFLTRRSSRTVRQSTITLYEVLEGLSNSDTRLHDEIVALLSDS